MRIAAFTAAGSAIIYTAVLTGLPFIIAGVFRPHGSFARVAIHALFVPPPCTSNLVGVPSPLVVFAFFTRLIISAVLAVHLAFPAKMPFLVIQAASLIPDIELTCFPPAISFALWS
jgi:hypothetical protein